MERVTQHEELPSGKVIIRNFAEDGSLLNEQHTYGPLDIGIKYDFRAGVKVNETYFSKQRLVSRKSYERARVVYSDMPPADGSSEDWGAAVRQAARRQQRQNKAEAAQRLAESAESQFPRPTSTNWLRVIARETAHLVVFASRDWKMLSREPLPTASEWLRLFGFSGPPDRAPSVAKGLEVGFEISSERIALLDASRSLLTEVTAQSGTSGARSKRQPPSAWPTVLPPLIDFLAGLDEATVKIFNHHR